MWAVVDTLVTEALATAGGRVRGVGISSAGPIDLPAGTVSPINITAVATAFRSSTGCRHWPVRLYGLAATGCAWRWGSGGAARAGARSSCSAWWCRPASAAGWCSTAALRRANRQRRTRRPRGRRPGRRAVHLRGPRLRRDDRSRTADGALGPRERLGCAGRGRREGAGRRRRGGRRGRAAGLQPGRDGAWRR